MIDSSSLMIFDTKVSSQKNDSSRAAENKSPEFSSYMKESKNSSIRSDTKVDEKKQQETRGSKSDKSALRNSDKNDADNTVQQKIEKISAEEIGDDVVEDENKSEADIDLIEITNDENNNILNQQIVPENEQPNESPISLVNFSQAISDSRVAADGQKRIEEGALVSQFPTSNLDKLIEKNEKEDNRGLLEIGKEKFNAKLLQAKNGDKDITSQVTAKSVDEVINIGDKESDLLVKFLEKIDLDKNKGESLFQDRIASDKALLNLDATQSSMNKISFENADKSILLNTVNNGARTSPSISNQQPAMATPITNPEWGEEFGKRIQMLVKNNVQYAEIRMDPPEMGRIQIRINMNQDQANITFTALHANVRDALDNNMIRLREMLDETGVQLGETNVNSQFKQQSDSRSDQQGGFLLQNQLAGSEGEELNAEIPSAILQHSVDGVIDYFA